jgi:hypothetical protein
MHTHREVPWVTKEPRFCRRASWLVLCEVQELLLCACHRWLQSVEQHAAPTLPLACVSRQGSTHLEHNRAVVCQPAALAVAMPCQGRGTPLAGSCEH